VGTGNGTVRAMRSALRRKIWNDVPRPD
jgi:hypothetical protein